MKTNSAARRVWKLHFSVAFLAFALTQSLALVLTAPAPSDQTTPVANATNATVSTAEVTAFMQAPQRSVQRPARPEAGGERKAPQVSGRRQLCDWEGQPEPALLSGWA